MLKNYHNEMGVCVLFYFIFIIHIVLCVFVHLLNMNDQVFFLCCFFFAMALKEKKMLIYEGRQTYSWNRNEAWLCATKEKKSSVVCFWLIKGLSAKNWTLLTCSFFWKSSLSLTFLWYSEEQCIFFLLRRTF